MNEKEWLVITRGVGQKSIKLLYYVSIQFLPQPYNLSITMKSIVSITMHE